MKKLLGSLFFILVAVVIFAAIAKDIIIKTAMEQGVTRVTGFPTRVESVNYNFPSTIHIKGLTIDNPAGFEKKTFVNIPEIYIAFVLSEYLKGQQIHFPEVRLALQEVNVEKNEKGISNIELLKSVAGEQPSTGASQGGAQEPQSKASKKPMPFWIEKLVLTIRNVSYLDRSGTGAGALPIGNKIDFDLNLINETLTDIKDAKSVVNVILSKILSGATLGKLLNIDPQQLLSGTVGQATQILDKGVGAVTGEAEKAAAQAKELLASGGSDLAAKAEALAGDAKTAIADNAVAEKAEALIKSSGTEAKEVLGDAASATKNQLSGLLSKAKSIATPEKVEAGK